MHFGFKGNIENRSIFFEKIGTKGKQIFSADLVHGTGVKKVRPDDHPAIIKETDALISSGPDTVLAVTVADCFPVYFYNQKQNVFGVAHSGWRGTVGNISEKTIKALGDQPLDILVGIGPGIQACHFEIKDDILDNFSEYPDAIIKRGEKIFVDLPNIIKSQIIETGVPEQNIESSGQCTFCQNYKYFSFRRDRPKQIQAMLAYIAKN